MLSLIFFGKYLRVDLLGHMVGISSAVYEAARSFSKTDIQFKTPSKVLEFQLLHILDNIWGC